jgi:hypothetical protein
VSDDGADWLSDEERALRLAIDQQMPGSGLYDRDVAIALLDRDLLVRDESGTPLNVREAIDELLERKPYLRDAMPAPTRVRVDQPPRGWARTSVRLARARRVKGILIAGRCR